jgi:hypothetical protein
MPAAARFSPHPNNCFAPPSLAFTAAAATNDHRCRHMPLPGPSPPPMLPRASAAAASYVFCPQPLLTPSQKSCEC